MGAPAGIFDPLTLPRKGVTGTIGMPGMSGTGGADPLQVEPTLTYRNQYGTDVSAGYNVGSGDITGRAVIPIGDAVNGNRLELRGGYGPSGPSAFIGFKKLNVPSLDQEAFNASIEQNDPEYAKYLRENPGSLERARAARERKMREAALGMNRSGAPSYELGLDVFGNRRMAGSGPFAGAMDEVMNNLQ